MMGSASQRAKAQRFLALHTAPELLVLPNAWDAGSAVILEEAGFGAIGTTSAGIAYSLGYPDGQRISLDDLLAVQARIVRRISVPLSVDIESGYGSGIEQVLDTVERVVAGGAVGINLEDGLPGGASRLADRQAQCELLRAICKRREVVGIPFVINARTDSFWLELGDERDRLTESVSRGNAYLDAGADCVFVPGAMTRDTVKALVDGIQGPLNLIATPGGLMLGELEELGVARLSIGSSLVRSALGVVRQFARDLVQGSLAGLSMPALGYDEANRLFDRPDPVEAEDA